MPIVTRGMKNKDSNGSQIEIFHRSPLVTPRADHCPLPLETTQDTATRPDPGSLPPPQDAINETSPPNKKKKTKKAAKATEDSPQDKPPSLNDETPQLDETPTPTPPPQDDSSDPQDHPQDNPPDPQSKAFHFVPSLLKVCSGHRAHRYPVSVEELTRRANPPESMSVNTFTSLLRMDKNTKQHLKEELLKVGVSPGPVTQVTSMCTRLTEGEAKDLCQSVGALAAKGINFEAVTMALPSDPDVAVGKATELKHYLQQLTSEIKQHGQDFDHLSHGLGPGMMDIVLGVFFGCIDANIAKLQ